MSDVNAELAKIKKFDPWKARKWREVSKISQRTLAQRMGLSARGYEYVCRCEAWTLGVTPGRLLVWAKTLRCKPSDLQSDAEELLFSRSEFDRWVAKGRPNVRDFVLGDPAQ